MKRTYVLGMIVIAGAVAAAAANVVCATAASGRTRPSGWGWCRPGARQDRKGCRQSLFRLRQGWKHWGVIAEKGVVLVDTKNPDNGQGILDRVKSVTDKPITHIINTHTRRSQREQHLLPGERGDRHAGEHRSEHAEDGAVPGSRQQARPSGSDLQGQDDAAQWQGCDRPLYFGPAHTNGDTFVVFRTARVVHAGDAFANKGQPLIDRNNGGSGIAYPETIRKAANGIKNVDVVINGHSPVTMKFQDLVDFGEFNRLFLEHARIAQGRQDTRAGDDGPEAARKIQGLQPHRRPRRPGGNFGVIFTELQEK